MKKIFGLWILLVIFLVAGCGTQDRYKVMEPTSDYPIEISDLGTLTRLPAIWNTSLGGAIVDETIHLNAGNGLINRVVPEGYQTLPSLPAGFTLNEMITGPDGRLWILSGGGDIYILEDESWRLEVDLEFYAWGMLLDNEDRVLVFGQGGELHQRELSGDWFQQDLPDSITIVDGWCEYGHSPILLSGNGHLITEESTGWVLGEVLVEGYNVHALEIEGSEDGQLAVRFHSSFPFLVFDGDSWQSHERELNLTGVFWFENHLFGVDINNQYLMRWDDESWSEFTSLGNAIACCSGFDSIAWGSNRLLFFANGQTQVFDGEEVTQQAPALGQCSGFVSFEGNNHLLLSKGLHMMEVDGIWREMGRPLGESNRQFPDRSLVLDDMGMPVFLGRYQIVTWDGDEYQEHPIDDTFEDYYCQTDGKLLFVTSFRMGLWASGEFRWLAEHGERSPSSIRSANLDSEGGVWIHTGEHVKLIEPASSTISLSFHGWFPVGAVHDPDWGLVCFGDDRLIVVNGADVQDMTPHWPAFHDREPCYIRTLIQDDFGGWLAFDTRNHRLLRFDGEMWLAMEQTLGWFSSSGSFTNMKDGTFILQCDGYVQLLELP